MKVLLVEDSKELETELRSVFDAIPQAEVIEVSATGRQASEWPGVERRWLPYPGRFSKPARSGFSVGLRSGVS